MATVDEFIKRQILTAMEQTRKRYADDDVMKMLAPPWAVRLCASYRQVCRLAWDLRISQGMTKAGLAEAVGIPASRISDYLSADDSGSKRDLPGQHVAAFGSALGNSAVSQWLCSNGQLTVIEEIRWERENPDLIPRLELQFIE